MRIPNTIILSSLLSFVYLQTAVAQTKNWTVRIASDGLHPHAICLLESLSQQVNDGQTMTPIKLVYNGELIMAVTKSNIDLSYDGVGLQVDTKAGHAVDGLYKKTRGLFKKDATDIVQEFIKGREARLVLGFWPSWPKSKTVTSRFSLRGFSRAYQAWQTCHKTGVIKK